MRLGETELSSLSFELWVMRKPLKSNFNDRITVIQIVWAPEMK